MTSDTIRIEFEFNWRRSLAIATVIVWFLASLSFVAFVRSFSMPVLPVMWILLGLICAPFAFIPYIFVQFVLKQFSSDRWRIYWLLALGPPLLSEVWFTSEEVSFRLWVGDQLEAAEPGAELDIWRNRRWPYDHYSMIYDGTCWVMD